MLQEIRDVPFREVEGWFLGKGANSQRAALCRDTLAQVVNQDIVPLIGPIPFALTGKVLADGSPRLRVSLICPGSSVVDINESLRKRYKREIEETGRLIIDCREVLDRSGIELAFIDTEDPDWNGRNPKEITDLMRNKGEYNVGVFWSNERLIKNG